jgi:hypothetical protein
MDNEVYSLAHRKESNTHTHTHTALASLRQPPPTVAASAASCPTSLSPPPRLTAAADVAVHPPVPAAVAVAARLTIAPVVHSCCDPPRCCSRCCCALDHDAPSSLVCWRVRLGVRCEVVLVILMTLHRAQQGQTHGTSTLAEVGQAALAITHVVRATSTLAQRGEREGRALQNHVSPVERKQTTGRWGGIKRGSRRRIVRPRGPDASRKRMGGHHSPGIMEEETAPPLLVASAIPIRALWRTRLGMRLKENTSTASPKLTSTGPLSTF